MEALWPPEILASETGLLFQIVINFGHLYEGANSNASLNASLSSSSLSLSPWPKTLLILVPKSPLTIHA